MECIIYPNTYDEIIKLYICKMNVCFLILGKFCIVL